METTSTQSVTWESVGPGSGGDDFSDTGGLEESTNLLPTMFYDSTSGLI